MIPVTLFTQEWLDKMTLGLKKRRIPLTYEKMKEVEEIEHESSKKQQKVSDRQREESSKKRKNNDKASQTIGMKGKDQVKNLHP